MAADRGGLQYTIRVRDRYSRNIRQFIEGINASKAVFREFAAEGAQANATADALKRTAKAAKDLANQNARGVRASEQSARAKRKELTVEEELARRQQAIRRARLINSAAEQRSINLTRLKTRQLSLEAEALKSADNAERRLAVTKRRNEILASRGIQIGKKAARQLTVEEEARNRLARAIRRQAVAQRQQQLEADQGLFITREITVEEAARRKLEAAIRRQAIQRELEIQAAQRGVQVGRATKRALTVEEEARKRIEVALRRQAVAQEEVNQRRARGLGIPPGVARNAQGLTNELGRTDNAASRLLFTFRRLFGVLALFQAARLAFRTFLDTVRAGINFNAQIQQSEIGIAALLSAVGDVRDALGGTVSPAQELALAAGEARKQIQLLRQDALNTASTFEQLLDTFQIAVAPGLTAGLDINEVREFTVRISQAASALGVAQNQLSEEIRSILSGTIQARTTRIATALGITNEDIRRAREAGVLFEFLSGEFSAFEAAGEKALGTFAGLTGRINDAFRALTGLASEDFFSNLLGTLREVFDLLTVQDPLTGIITPDPQVAAIFQEIFDVLSEGLDRAREAAVGIGFEDAQSAARAFAQTLLTIAEIAIGVAQGVAEAVAVLVDVFEFLSAGTGSSVRDIAAGFARVAAFVIAIVLPLRTVLGLFTGIGGGVLSLIGKMRTLNATIKAAGGLSTFLQLQYPKLNTALSTAVARTTVLRARLAQVAVALAGVTAAVAIVTFGFREILEEVFDTELTLKQTVLLIGIGLADVLRDNIDLMKRLGFEFNKFADDVFLFLAEKADDLGTGVKAAILAIKAERGDKAAANELRLLAAEQQELAKAREAEAKAREGATAAERQALRDDVIARQAELSKKIAEITTAEGVRGEGFDPNFKASKAKEEAKGLLAIFEKLQLPLSTANQEIAKIDELLTSLTDKSREAQISFDFAQANQGVSGPSRQIAEIFDTATKETAEKSKALTEAIVQDEARLANLIGARNSVLARGVALREDEKRIIDAALVARTRLVELERERERIATEARRLQLESQVAARNGDTGQAAALALEARRLETQAEAIQGDKERIEGVLERLQLEGDGADILATILQLQTDIASTEADITNQKGAQADLAREAARAAALQAATIAVTQIPQLQEDNRSLEARAEAEARVTAAQERRASTAQQNFITAQNEVALRRVESEIAQETLQANVASTQNSIAQLAADDQGLAVLQELLAAQQDKLANEKAISGELEKQLLLREEEARKLAEGTLAEGLSDGFREFANQFSSAFQVGLNIATQGVEQFAGFVSSTIVDAFDPTTETDILERFARFLQQLASLILNELIKLAIARAILNASTGGSTFLTGSPIGNVGAFRKGGQVGQGYSASPAHYAPGVRGYMHGNIIGGPRHTPPKGVHPADNVPIWAQAGEFMFSRPAVAALGVDFLERLHSMARAGLNMNSLSAIGATGTSRTRRRGMGYIDGGEIEQLGRGLERTAGTEPSTGGGVQRAVVVANEESFDRQLAAGSGAMMRFLRRNGFTPTGGGR
ncbi:MAG TPA: hypothetical protein VM285_11610 [Polyangia bacterium]|nr:hypothetical protein [Polyangia bacterium]